MSEADTSAFQFPDLDSRSNNSSSSGGGHLSHAQSIKSHYSSADYASNSSESSSSVSDSLYENFHHDTSNPSVPTTPRNTLNDYSLADSYRNSAPLIRSNSYNPGQKFNHKLRPISVSKSTDQLVHSFQTSPNSSSSSTPVIQGGGGPITADRKSNASSASSSGLLVGASSATVGTTTTGVNGSGKSSTNTDLTHLSNDLSSTLKSAGSSHPSNNIVDNFDWNNSSNDGSSSEKQKVPRKSKQHSRSSDTDLMRLADKRKQLGKINTKGGKHSRVKNVKDNRYLTKNQVLAYKSFLNNTNFNQNQINFFTQDATTKSKNKNHHTFGDSEDEKYNDFLSIAPSLIDGYTLTSQLISSNQLPTLMYHAIDDLSGEKVLIRMSPNYIDFNSTARFLNEWYILSNLNPTYEHRIFTNEILSNEFMSSMENMFLDKSDPSIYQPVTLPHEIPGVLYPMKILNIDSQSTDIHQKRMGLVFQDYDYTTLKDFHGDYQDSYIPSSRLGSHFTSNGSSGMASTESNKLMAVEKADSASYGGGAGAESIPTSSSSMISDTSDQRSAQGSGQASSQGRLATRATLNSDANSGKSNSKYDEFKNRINQPPQTPFKIIEVLNDIIAILKTLATVHELGIVHNGITSHTILKSTDEHLAMNEVVLTGWDFCFSIPQEDCSHGIRRSHLTDVPELLPYLSPESSGEFSSQVDYRTDFYSIGVVLYELVVGVLPFQSETPSKMVRMHLLQKPIAPSLIGNGWISEDLSDIIMKCLEKSAANRYSDCVSLINSLIRVKNTYVDKIVKLQPVHGVESMNSSISTKTPEQSLNTSLNTSFTSSTTAAKLKASLHNNYIPFTPHQKISITKEEPYFPEKCNIPPRINFSSSYHGRYEDFNEFIIAYESMQRGANLLLIRGPEGVGKTSLLRDLKSTALSKYDFFSYWKFNRQDRNLSMYSSFLHGIKSVIIQILNGPKEDIAVWRDLITSKIQLDLSVMFNNIPELETLLGPKYASICKNRRYTRQNSGSQSKSDNADLNEKYAKLGLKDDTVSAKAFEVDEQTVNLELKFRYIIKAFYCLIAEQGLTNFCDDFQLCTKNEWGVYGEILEFAKVNDIDLSLKLIAVFDEGIGNFESGESFLDLDEFKSFVEGMGVKCIQFDLKPLTQDSFTKSVFSEFVYDSTEKDKVSAAASISSDYSNVSASPSLASIGKTPSLSAAKDEELRSLAEKFFDITGGSILLFRYLTWSFHFLGDLKFDSNTIKQEKTISLNNLQNIDHLEVGGVPQYFLEAALTPDAKSLMKFAALISGADYFSLSDLMIVSKLSMKQVFELIQLCVETKVIIPTSAYYKLPFHLMSSGDFPFDLSDALIWDLSSKCTYRFSHDFLQSELLRELKEDNELGNYHRLCGLRFYKVLKKDESIHITKYLVMATHLSKSWELAEKHEHEIYLDALINAARYANSTYSLNSSLRFFEVAEHFVESSDSKKRLKIISAVCQLRFFLGQFDTCLQIIDKAEKDYGYDETMFLLVRIRCYFQLNSHKKGLTYAIKCLRKLGVDVSLDPEECKKTFERTSSQLPLSVTDLKKMRHLSATKNPKILMIYELISEIVAPSYVAQMESLRHALVSQMVLLMHIHGGSAYCAMGLLEFGNILCREDNYTDMMKAIEFCKLGLHLVDIDKETRGSVAQHVYEIYVTGLAAFSEPLSNILRYSNVFLSSRKSFLRFDFSSMQTLMSSSKIHLLYLSGYPTSNLIKAASQQFIGYGGDEGIEIQLDLFNVYGGDLSIDDFKNKYSKELKKRGLDFEFSYSASLVYWYAGHGLYQEASSIFLDHCYKLSKKLPLSLIHFELYFQAAVSLTKNKGSRRKKGMEVAHEILKKFELWANVAPSNFGSKYLIIKACFSAIDKESSSLDTLDIFENAIDKAKECSSWYDVGQGHLLCASWLANTKKSSHRVELHVKDALIIYKRLECRVYVARIEQQFSKYLDGHSWAGVEFIKHEYMSPTSPSPTMGNGSSPLGDILRDFFGDDNVNADKPLQRRRSKFFDAFSNSSTDLVEPEDSKSRFPSPGIKKMPTSNMESLTKAITACLTITESTEDEMIISNLLESAILFSGVDYGVVVTIINEEPTIQAIASPNSIYRLENEPLSSRTDLCPFSLLMDVLHTANYVNQDEDPIYFATRFGKDDYFVHNQSITSICIPLRTQNGIFGAIYLENQTKSSGSKKAFFNSQKHDLLELICSQAAVSLEKAKLYSQMEIAKRAAEDATEEKASFLANMSHEIRTPFNSLLSCAIFLLDTELTKTQREYVETIKSSAMVTLSIIDGILNFSKIEHGSFLLDSAPFSLNDCVESALQLSAEQAAANNIELVYFNRCQFLDSIIGDVTRFRQIIINLVGNSVKFTNNGYIRIESTATKITDDRYEIIISVKDTGIGIPEDSELKVFGAFSQVDGSSRRVYGGSGLGLAISKKLAEIMNGSLSFESKEGEGSTFYFISNLSVNLSQKPEIYFDIEEAKILGFTNNVLIIDTHELNRQVLGEMIEDFGLNVTYIDRVKDLKSTKNDFAVIFLDHDQIDEFRAIDDSIDTSRCRIILLARFGQALPRGIENCCFHSIIFSPFQRNKIISSVKQLISDMKEPSKNFKGYIMDKSSKIGNAEPTKNSLVIADKYPLRILLAEDNLINIKVALQHLKKLGYEADHAKDGIEVLEKCEALLAKNEKYDVILMDIQMPRKDGIAATIELKESFIHKGKVDYLPAVVALTANVAGEDRAKSLNCGMVDFISKPILPGELKRVLESLGEKTKGENSEKIEEVSN